MKWTRPIYNKTAQQYMNVADIKRLAGNIEYVHYALLAGASISTPSGVAEMVTKLTAVTTSSIISKCHGDGGNDIEMLCHFPCSFDTLIVVKILS